MLGLQREGLLMADEREVLIVKRLSSGVWHVRGRGICNWAQGYEWPPEPFCEASEEFMWELAHMPKPHEDPDRG